MATQHTQTSPISAFRMRWNLNLALSDARSMNDSDHYQDYPATRAGFALALDTRDHEQLSLAGSYGAAICDIYAVMDDGEIMVAGEYPDDPCISEDRACELLVEDGEIDADDVHALHGTIWDGHNHVPFVPSRALGWLTGEDAWERRGHLLVQWDDDGSIIEMRLDQGWDEFDCYYDTLGNQGWTHEGVSVDTDITSRLDAAGVAYDEVWLGDGDVEILVPSDQMDAAEAAMCEDEDEDDD